MSDNKFIKRLKGEQTAKSVLEIKNESAKTSFANMPQGSSNAINVYSDHRGNATAVLEGTDIWKLSNSQFVVVPNAFGDGQDFTSTYTVAGSSLWVNATHTFDQPKIFTGATQWTLKLCGHSLLSSLSNTIGFSLIIKFGNAVTITKSFSVSESAFEFCKEFIIDFSESEQSAIKVANGDTMTVQLLCADATASATIYNGMTTLVAQQRRVDGEAVASDLHTFEDLEVEIADIADDLADHIADKNNPHEVTKAQVGLGNCDNTSDIDKPISSATQTALDGKVDKTTVANKVYGTDAQGNQTTYDKGSFGQVDDVKVNNVSVVTNKVANIDLTGYVTLSTTQAITGTKTFKAEILSWNNITFESAQANPIIRGMSGASYRNMITRTNSASAIDVGNTSDTINFKGSGTRPTYNSNDLALYSDIGNATITITQGGTTMGTFTTNQSGDQTIALDSGGYRPDLFDVKWADHICNDVQWLRADTFSWQSGAVYQAAYQHLVKDLGITSLTITATGKTYTFIRDSRLDGPGYYGWNASGMYAYTASDMPDIGTRIYYDTSLTGAYDTIESVSYNATAQTETVAGTTITYYLADDGHKICLADQESNVTAIYNATGVAWYYIIDTTNQRFKLPRTKFGFTGIRSGVGNYVEAGLPNITADFGSVVRINPYNTSGPTMYANGAAKIINRASLYNEYSHVAQSQGANYPAYGYEIDASLSSSTYGNSDTVQPKATEMYLYFYVGNFTQTALENTAGLNAELFNGKADLNLANVLANIDFVVESQLPTAANNYTWYRKYRSGWVEQGGRVPGNTSGSYNVTMPVEMANTNYNFIGTGYKDSDDAGFVAVCIDSTSMTTTGFRVYPRYVINGSTGSPSQGGQWQVSGMAA